MTLIATSSLSSPSHSLSWERQLSYSVWSGTSYSSTEVQAPGGSRPRVHRLVALAHRLLGVEGRHSDHPARLAIDQHREPGALKLGRQRALVDGGPKSLQPRVDICRIPLEPRQARPHAVLPLSKS